MLSTVSLEWSLQNAVIPLVSFGGWRQRMPGAADGQPAETTVCLDVAVAVSAELTRNLAKMKDLLKYCDFRRCF